MCHTGIHKDTYLTCGTHQRHTDRLEHPYPRQHLKSMCHLPGRFSPPLHEHSRTRREHTTALWMLLLLSMNGAIIFVIPCLCVSFYFYLSFVERFCYEVQVPPVSASCVLRGRVGTTMPSLILFYFVLLPIGLENMSFFHLHLTFSLGLVKSDIFYDI